MPTRLCVERPSVSTSVPKLLIVQGMGTPREEGRSEWSEALVRLWRFSRLRLPELKAIFGEAFDEWSDDNAPRLGASLAFYALLSLAPLLIVVIAVAAFVYGKQAAQGQLFWQIRGLVGAEVAKGMQGLIRNAYNPGTGVLATILGVIALAFGASSVVVELRDSLNAIWHVPPRRGAAGLSSVLVLLKERFYAFAMILSAGFLLLVSLILNAAIAGFGAVFGPALSIPEPVLHVLTFTISFVVVTGIFAAIYKLVPDVSLKWGDVIVGATVTSLLFGVGKLLIELYLRKASLSSAYGAAGSLVVVLVWVYYSAQLFFLGAEFTKIYTKYCGSQLSGSLELTVPNQTVTLEPSNRVNVRP